MTRKFILKKEYPNSCSLGTIFTEGSPKTFYASVKDGNQTIRRYSSYWNEAYFTKNPEYYEEVIEKDYEILSFYQPDHKGLNIYNLLAGCKGMFYELEGNTTGNLVAEELLLKLNYSIHSVKRLSDGEVFTVGDKVKYNSWSNYLPIVAITLNDKLSFTIKDTPHQCNYYNWQIFKKSPKPLFTTEDGKDVYEGDLSYMVIPSYFIEGPNKFLGLRQDCKYFSTKEAAEEYILMNKPCLSINDIKDLVEDCSYTKSQKLLEFKKLVKSRL